ncbi:response regulator transcription factor [Streptomyces roseochromogenus]|uniref:response regulator transcription factor n=1 Tax=Streptomyces roseochromogenus TaxID=285450 RepID=UPI00131A4916|nr:response regulator transcription factor [Streptomyces roseochromogenus]
MESQPKLSVVAEGRIRETLSMVAVTRPDLILFRFSSYEESIQPLTQLKRLTRSPVTLLVLERVPERGARQLLTLGASGILLQESASQHLPWAITAALKGGCALSPEIARRVINEYTAPITESARKRAAQAKIHTLTTREREVLELLSEGLSNQSIAHTLTISPGTVKDHVRSICAKLNAEGRIHAARIAWQANDLPIRTQLT